MDGWMNNEWMNERTNERMNEYSQKFSDHYIISHASIQASYISHASDTQKSFNIRDIYALFVLPVVHDSFVKVFYF